MTSGSTNWSKSTKQKHDVDPSSNEGDLVEYLLPVFRTNTNEYGFKFF